MAGLFLAAAFPLNAQDAGQAKPQSSETIVVTGKIPDANKKVCKTEAATGSIIPKRICRTKGEWAEITARSIATVERMKAEQTRESHTQAVVENE
ncbi:MAG TPA: hypothetical protein VNJ05_02205 [Sphingomicrobium sp.]|nr:hypothetical protein [Sphingomicrobium sp.]